MKKIIVLLLIIVTLVSIIILYFSMNYQNDLVIRHTRDYSKFDTKTSRFLYKYNLKHKDFKYADFEMKNSKEDSYKKIIIYSKNTSRCDDVRIFFKQFDDEKYQLNCLFDVNEYKAEVDDLSEIARNSSR